MKKSFLLVSLLFSLFALAQEQIETIDDIQLEQIKPNQIKKYWLKMIDNGLLSLFIFLLLLLEVL